MISQADFDKAARFQDDGRKAGFSADARRTVSDALRDAKAATPQSLRHLFRARIYTTAYGYHFEWILIG